MNPSSAFAKLLIIPDLVDIGMFASALKLTEEELQQLEQVVTAARNLPETMTLTAKIDYLATEIENWIINDKNLNLMFNETPLHQRVKIFGERMDTTSLFHDALNVSEHVQFFKDILFIITTNKDLLEQLAVSKLVDTAKSMTVRSGGTLINLIQHEMRSHASDLNLPIIGAGLFAGWALLKEASFDEKKQIKDAEFQRVKASSEKNCLTLLQMYGTVENYYANLFRQTPEMAHNPAILKERKDICRFINGQIKALQNEIACLGAAKQEQHSKRRLNRSLDFLNIALSVATIAGPPAVIGAAIIKSLTTIGELSVGVNVVNSSAMFNHGVTQENPIAVITDEESEKNAMEIINASVGTTLAITGPIIQINESVEAAEGRISCAFALSSAPPEIPKLPDPLDAKLLGKHLDKIADMQAQIRQELHLLTVTYNKLILNKTSWPSVTNLAELMDNLKQRNDAINQQIRSISDSTLHMPERLKIISESTNLAHDLEGFQSYVEIKQRINPFDQLFKNGAVDQTELLKGTYSLDDKEKQRLYDDINFSLKAMNSMMDHCDAVAGGRHIVNTNELITELQSKLSVLKHFPTTNPDPNIRNNENIKIKQLENDIETLSKKLAERIPKEDSDEAELNTLSVIDFTKINETDAIVMPERDAFGIWKDDDRKVGVYGKLIGLTANNSKNIQIEPLTIPTNKHLLAACRGDLANLSLIIEGIKTEMQWVTKFMEATNGQIRILNANQLLLYYKAQVERLEQVLNNPEKYLGKKEVMEQDTNVIKKQFHEFKKFINGPENQLSRAYTALEKMYSQQDKTLHHEKEEKPEQTPQSVADEEQTPTYFSSVAKRM